LPRCTTRRRRTALTDHDELSGLEEARQAAREFAIRLIDGLQSYL
jgi:predicted metal-dependent phosphoesterase TrpH